MSSICDSVLDAVDDFVDIADRALTRLRLFKSTSEDSSTWNAHVHHHERRGVLIESSTRPRAGATWNERVSREKVLSDRDGIPARLRKPHRYANSTEDLRPTMHSRATWRGQNAHFSASRSHLDRAAMNDSSLAPKARNAYRKLDEIFNGPESSSLRPSVEAVDYSASTAVVLSKPLPAPPKAHSRDSSPAKPAVLKKSTCQTQKKLPPKPSGRLLHKRIETAPSSWRHEVKSAHDPKGTVPFPPTVTTSRDPNHRSRSSERSPYNPCAEDHTTDRVRVWLPVTSPKPPARRYSYVEDTRSKAEKGRLPRTRSMTPPGIRTAKSATPLTYQLIDSPGFRGPSLKLDELSPDLQKCDVLVIAVAEMEICKEVFSGWKAQLDLAEADPRRGDKLEASIISTVEKLNIGANGALQSSHAILHLYQSISQTIERRLDDISRLPSYKSHSGGGQLFPPSTTSIMKAHSSALASHSQALTGYVQRMQALLRELVRDLELTKEGAARRALRRKIWLWIARVFRALSMILSAGGAIVAFVYPLGLLETSAIAGASMFSGAVAKLCELAHEKYEDTKLDAILAFLQTSVPESAQAAFLALTSFQACHRVLRLELEVREGKRAPPWVSTRDASAAKSEWKRASEKLHAVDRRAEFTNSKR